MTVDDENSIYVGGLPYNATEDTVRRVFDPYGAIIAIKIVNDRGTRGKCYGFVTFRNPRSVIDAINEMNGKTIDGRVVRVNGVTTRGGRAHFNREHLRHNTDRGIDRERGRDRDRDRYWERFSDRSRERDRSWGNDDEREEGYELANKHVRTSDVFFDRDRSRERDMADNEQEQGRNNNWNWDRDAYLDGDRGREMNETNGVSRIVDKETEQHLKRQNGSTNDDQRSKEVSSASSDGYNHAVKDNLDRTLERHDVLKKEISQMEDKLEDDQQLVSNMRKKVKKLEDTLINAKKYSSLRKMQLTKLHKCFLEVKEYTERLKSSEQELQSLVDSALMEIDMGDNVRSRDGILANGNP